MRMSAYVSCTKILNLETGRKDSSNFHLGLLQNVSAVSTAHHPIIPTTSSLTFLSEKADNIISEFPNAEIIILGDLNVHNKEWLASTRTDP